MLILLSFLRLYYNFVTKFIEKLKFLIKTYDISSIRKMVTNLLTLKIMEARKLWVWQQDKQDF